MPPCACMTHNSSTYLRCSQLFHNVNNSKQQDPAVTLTLPPLDKSALQICFPIPCAPRVTMATLPWIFIPTQLCIGLLHYRKSYDFTLCPRRPEHRTPNTEHRTPNVCDIDREKLRTMSSQSQESQVGGTGNAISNPLCILASLWKERTITINSFCCRCCCFIFGKNSAPMYMYESRPKREVIHFSFLFLHRRWTVENVLGERYN